MKQSFFSFLDFFIVYKEKRHVLSEKARKELDAFTEEQLRQFLLENLDFDKLEKEEED